MKNLGQRLKTNIANIRQRNVGKHCGSNIVQKIGKMNKNTFNNKRKKNIISINKVIIKHISENLKEYLIVSLFFLIGIILGVVVINNSDSTTRSNIQGYIQTFIDSLKSNEYKIDIIKLLQMTIINNVKLVVIIWLVGSTVIGMPLIYGIVGLRGFCLGYTISAIIATIGSSKGISFAISALFLQNILIIPGIFAICISSIKLYRAIMQDRRRENIKLEICRHSMFSFIILIIFTIAAIFETYGSANLIMLTAKYM